MKLRELKEWIDSLPIEFLDFDIENAESGYVEESNEEFTWRLDKPITTLLVDEENREILFLNDEPK